MYAVPEIVRAVRLRTAAFPVWLRMDVAVIRLRPVMVREDNKTTLDVPAIVCVFSFEIFATPVSNRVVVTLTRAVPFIVWALDAETRDFPVMVRFTAAVIRAVPDIALDVNTWTRETPADN